MNIELRKLALTVALVLSTQAVSAQSIPLPTESAETLFGRSASPGQTLAQYLERRAAEFLTFDIDGDGVITEADIALHRQLAAAMARSMAIRDLLQFDLDGDGVITRAEVEISLHTTLGLAALLIDKKPDELRRQFQVEVDRRMQPDTNGDGRIDGAEILAYARRLANPNAFRGNLLLWVALTTDQDNDGRVTREEYLKAAEAAFRKVDTDGDGTLSKDELDAFRKQTMPPPAGRPK